MVWLVMLTTCWAVKYKLQPTKDQSSQLSFDCKIIALHVTEQQELRTNSDKSKKAPRLQLALNLWIK